jgi:predicted Ser/Thr protein kinase
MGSSVVTGSVIAGFRVQSQIGAGAMGSVYLAEDTRTGMPVALKLLASELATDERFRQRFARESALAAALDHPHVVEIVGSGDADGLLFLAMAFVDGPDLREVIRRDGRLEPDRAVRLVEQAAAALDAAHAAGLVHRDVKPANILIERRPDGEHAYVCDFGLARHVSSVSSLTGERGFVGTIDYISPEQIEGQAIDGRTDVYSLGCVLFECLTGARPFGRESELSVVFAHLNEPPPRISELRPELPAAFDAIFAVALAKAPDDRYPTCGALAEAAREASQGRVARPRTIRRRRWVVGGVTLVAAAVAAIVGVVATGGGSPAASGPLIPRQISEIEMAGARLGQPAAYYKQLFGGYREATIAGPNYPTLAFQQPEVAVYFPSPGKGAIIITTWNQQYRTAKRIGPCSTLADMKKAYGSAVKASEEATLKDGSVHAYVVGDNLLFSTQNMRTISSVALYRGSPGNTGDGSPQAYANYVAANETACISG